MTFKHSSRRRPLNDSMCPFCVGFPGYGKSSFTPQSVSKGPHDSSLVHGGCQQPLVSRSRWWVVLISVSPWYPCNRLVAARING